MESVKKNKEFIIRYINAISGEEKTTELIEQFVIDPKLKAHIQFFESSFPKYEILIDEITAEGDRVVVRARSKGKHEGEVSGIPATGKEIEMPFVIGYEIKDQMIVDHWAIGDQLLLMQQLGVMNEPA